MPTYRLPWNQPAPDEAQRAILTLGNFDGVHRGHAALVQRARVLAAPMSTRVVAVTFDPHPLQLLRPERFEPLLTTLDQRATYLHGVGVDHVVILAVDHDMLKLSARAFFDDVLMTRLEGRGFVEGPNFGFGHKREGTVATLAGYCAEVGLPCAVVEPLVEDGVLVSSSRIRHALLAGDPSTATRGLGRRYSLTGMVGKGQRRGVGLGFPTANLIEVATLIPGDGVYAGRALVKGTTWPAAVNVGPNPTFGEQERKVEAHLIGFAGDVYGQRLTLEFLARLRATRKFASADELLGQIRADVEQARQMAECTPEGPEGQGFRGHAADSLYYILTGFMDFL